MDYVELRDVHRVHLRAVRSEYQQNRDELDSLLDVVDQRTEEQRHARGGLDEQPGELGGVRLLMGILIPMHYDTLYSSALMPCPPSIQIKRLS